MKMRVKDNENFVKDSKNLAILNTDTSAIKRHQTKMEQLNRQKHYDDEINNLKNELGEIKKLLHAIVDKRI